MSELPASLDDLTFDWVKSVLAGYPDLVETVFTKMEKEDRDENSGLVSDSAILTLTTSAGDTYRMLIKLQASHKKRHSVAVQQGSYAKEVGFYNHFADQISAKTPKVYFAQYDETVGRVAILMEFIEGVYAPDAIEGFSQEEAEAAVLLLAGITAAFWDNQEALNFPWMHSIDADDFKQFVEWSEKTLPAFKESLQDILSEEEFNIAQTCVDNRAFILEKLRKGHKVLSHGDYRTENLLFSLHASKEVTVIDWQTVIVNTAAHDFVYMLVLSLKEEERKAWRDSLINLFLSQLAIHGVKEYQKKEFIEEIKVAALSQLNTLVVGVSMIAKNDERLQTIYRLFVKGVLSLIQDMDCLSVLPD